MIFLHKRVCPDCNQKLRGKIVFNYKIQDTIFRLLYNILSLIEIVNEALQEVWTLTCGGSRWYN